MNRLVVMWTRLRRRRASPHPAEPAAGAAPEPDEDWLPRGWFISSLDLRDGLAVIEHERWVVDASALVR